MEAAFKDGIAEILESQAGWRGEVAARFPHDDRNEHAANSLYEAAEWVRSLPLDSPEFKHIESMIDALISGGYLDPDDPPDPYIVLHAGYFTSRYGFDTLEMGILDRLHNDSLQQYADMIQENLDNPGFRQPAKNMVDYFKDMGVPLFGVETH